MIFPTPHSVPWLVGWLPLAGWLLGLLPLLLSLVQRLGLQHRLHECVS